MEHRKLRYLLSSVVALIALQVQAEAQSLPKLVVCITIDQLRTDYLRELEPMMSDGGFRLMLKQGYVSENVTFPFYPINAASATASLFTGLYPSEHGIEGNEVYHRTERTLRPIMWDDTYQGVYTRETLSPSALLATTLGDRLKEASQGTALVYSIAPTAEEAISSAGSLVDGAYWIDSKIGSWATSSYYPPMPPKLEQYNRSSEGLNKRLIQGLQWRPLRSYPRPSIAYSNTGRTFVHRYQAHEAEQMKRGALVNEEVTRLALRLLECAGYEERQSPGLLALSYTASPQTSSELDAEDVDTYIRLDGHISELLQALDKRFGLGNCLISLSGTGYTSYVTSSLYTNPKEKLKREVSPDRITALANMYLTASHGAGNWIEYNRAGKLYLNRQLIESKNLDLGQLQRRVADFIRKADGIASAEAMSSITTATQGSPTELLKRSIHPRYEADVYWQVLPRWSIEGEQDYKARSISTTIPSPFILMGNTVDASSPLLRITQAPDIVSAICTVLRIRPPNDRR